MADSADLGEYFYVPTSADIYAANYFNFSDYETVRALVSAGF